MSYRQQLRSGTRVIETLSPREIEVLIFVGRGYTNPQIARTLWISTETVKSHIRHILEKLGSSSRAQAVVVALQTGQVSLTDMETQVESDA